MAHFRIYYPTIVALQANPRIMFSPDSVITAADLRTSHRLVAVIEADKLEDCFEKMQGEFWSPNGEARELIEALGVTHTSMSVGDVVVDQSNTVWLCANVGWKDMGPLPERP